MKYIKTVDGLYDTTKGLYTSSIKMYAIGTKTIYENEIIQEADTIEELCDELVYVDNSDKKSVKIFHTNWWQRLKASPKKGHTVYGAIWCDKGLIYVAKMNEEGKLCLI